MHPIEGILLIVLGLPALATLVFLWECYREGKEYDSEHDLRD